METATIAVQAQLGYTTKVLATQAANLISYWPMNEASGSVADDYSAQSNDGAYTSVTLGKTGIGDGLTCPNFDGTDDYMNGYSAGFAADFDGDEGTVMVWAKVSGSGIWTDGLGHRCIELRATNDRIFIFKSSTNNLMQLFRYANGVWEGKNVSSVSSTDWMHLAIVWSVAGDYVRAYLDGVQQGTDVTSINAWVGGAPTVCLIGATTTTPTTPWSGRLAHAAIWNKALTGAEIAALAMPWTDLTDDVQDGSVRFDYGNQNTGLLDLVAGTGTLHFDLNNSISNSGAKQGYYTPGHADVRSGWDEGIRVRMKFSYGGTNYYKWVGHISQITPKPGAYGPRLVEVEAVDWMDQAAAQKISQLAIETTKRVDEVLPSILANMPIEPRATSYATGVETFSRVFDTDNDEKMSPMALFQKLARNEYGLIYLKGDTTGGETLRFDSRHTRPLNTSSIVTLNGTMSELEIEYSREAVKNLAQARIYPKKVDTGATTIIYEAQQKFSISPGQSVTLVLSYRDPTTSRPISAANVEWPFVADTNYKFGSSEGTANDLNASLGSSSTIGGNSMRLVLTNNAAVVGWVNLLKLRGNGIYLYDPQTLESKNQTSINMRGELPLTIELEQHDSQVTGQAFADYLKNRGYIPCKVPKSMRFLANRSSTLMTAALAGEPSSRITLQESVSALNEDYFINGVEFDIAPNKLIWCKWTVVPANMSALFIWDTSKWDTDTYWAF